MKMKQLTRLLLITIVLLSGNAGARNIFKNSSEPLHKPTAGEVPYATVAVHNIGKIAMSISNLGIIGNGDYVFIDPLTGERAPSLNYPRGLRPNYLDHAALWVGAIKGNDTLVSTASGLSYYEIHEFWPDSYPEGDIIFRSNKDPEAPEYDSSVSNQDFIAVYFDTITNDIYTGFDYATGERHRPLNLQVTQSSYAWGYDYAEDFIIIDYQILYRGDQDLDGVYIGLFVDPDIGISTGFNGGDDIVGLKREVPSKYIPDLVDTINTVWAADNNGDPNAGGSLQGDNSPASVMGIKVLRTPSDQPNFAFNWWVPSYNTDYDWGPRKLPPGQTTVRDFYGALGTPYTDMDKYYVMARGEVDYDQVTTAFDHSASGWLPPPANANSIAYGADVRFLVSCGPFHLKRGTILPFTIAFVMGEQFYATKRGVPGYWKFRDFADLGLNATWASWVFDNPGVDTDGDGKKGKFYVEVFDSTFNENDSQWVATYAETTYYAGDGVPDFEGANPPPVPKFHLTPRVTENYTGEIEVRWNGRVSETTKDKFSQQVDFEGYRVYLSISDRDDDFVLRSSYDIDNFDRFTYNIYRDEWEIVDMPFELKTLRAMYGDDFAPLEYYDPEHNFRAVDPATGDIKAYYFRRHDWNQSDYRDTTLIHKVYPDQPYPSTLNIDSAAMYYPDEVTEDGYLKYFEYSYVLRGLLPSQRYFVSVTTFDHGYPQRELAPQESNPSTNAIEVFAQNSTDLVESKGLNVVVYPNPYRADAHYEDRYEGWDTPNMPLEYNRAINFTNLPPKCTIRIFTIDGDLVRTIEHDEPPGGPRAMHEKWDLISRNTMMAVSGIYYFSVESEFGNQIGKLVIIR